MVFSLKSNYTGLHLNPNLDLFGRMLSNFYPRYFLVLKKENTRVHLKWVYQCTFKYIFILKMIPATGLLHVVHFTYLPLCNAILQCRKSLSQLGSGEILVLYSYKHKGSQRISSLSTLDSNKLQQKSICPVIGRLQD